VAAVAAGITAAIAMSTDRASGNGFPGINADQTVVNSAAENWPAGKRPANWFTSHIAGAGFELPPGWSAEDDYEKVELRSPSGEASAWLLNDTTLVTADFADDIASAVDQAEDVFGAWGGVVVSQETRTDLGPFTWWDLSIAFPDDDFAVGHLYVTDLARGGSCQVYWSSPAEAADASEGAIKTVLRTFTP
jgi:hypothetical protein